MPALRAYDQRLREQSDSGEEEARPLRRVAASLAHMHINRLLGTADGDPERTALALAANAAASLTAAQQRSRS